MLTTIQDKIKNTIIRKACPFCGKIATEKSHEIVNQNKIIKLECNHSIVETLKAVEDGWKTKSLSGKEPFKYQYVTNDFAINANHRLGIFHEQGVGKTICALLPVTQFKSEMTPFLVVCKASLKTQWFQEILDWTELPAQFIDNPKDKLYPNLFKAFIISYDLVGKASAKLQELGLKYVILDECQQIKNSGAKRTQNLREFIKTIPDAKLVALSGTPIKNHAAEYFPVLNLLHPEIFHSQAQFERDFCDTYSNGYSYKIGGLSRYAADEFKELTKDWIIRYTREEVLPDLPKIFRKNFFVELGPEVEEAYKKAFIEARDEFETASNQLKDQANLLAKLNRLRHITGLAKIEPVTDFVTDFLEDNDRKIVLFVHHKDVGLGLANWLGRVCTRLNIEAPLQLTSEMSGKQTGDENDRLFKQDKSKRIMIASTLSAGEGKNWQMCADMIMVEHQWNPANEEQCEGRFPRPGQLAQSINATYAIALGTPDEYLAELKAKKREICKRTMGNEAIAWSEESTIKEMCELLFSRGAKRWNL